MTDVPANSTTTSTLSLGNSVSGLIETGGDHDWYKIQLTGGQTVSIGVDASGSSPLEDPYVRIRDASGTIIFENDDGGSGRNALLTFEVPSSGTYYVDVAAWDDETGSYQYTGGYTVTARPYTPPSEGTIDQFAAQLVSGYWEGSSHHFDVAPGGTLTVNITALTANGQTLARTALAQWTEVIGVTFREVSTGGQIIFDDNEEGAHADANWSGGITSSATINVSTEWLADYGTGINSYSYQTYVHEIGHALGLGHAGNYNGEASTFDMLYSNDGWPMSIMSYFSPEESNHYSGLGFTSQRVATPMLADIVAMQQLYGLSTTTRTGNTIYGFNSNAGNPVYDAAQYPAVTVTIVDSGGIDTLDYSLYSGGQRIDLNPDQFSNVNGRTGNLAIARGVTIENAIGGSGDDVIVGNSAANVLRGGAGNDTLEGGLGDDSLVGGSGADILRGGLGNDEFRVENVGDLIQESIGEGDDTVLVMASFALAAGVAVETLRAEELPSTTAMNLTGNEFAQLIIGNAGANVLSGGGGNDHLASIAGNDSLIGGLGADVMSGGTGNDQYRVDNAGDVTHEAAGEGDDTVFVSASYALGAGSEIETLRVEELGSTGAINLNGNEFGQLIIGNAGANILNGGGGNDHLASLSGNDSLNGGSGADLMRGGLGDDEYRVDDSGDLAEELAGEGYDIVFVNASFALGVGQSIEILRVEDLASTNAINLTGNELAQLIIGNAGSNLLNGGSGNDHLAAAGGNDTLLGGVGDDLLRGGLGDDMLTGGSGADTFAIWETGGADRITDFVAGGDVIDLSPIDANTGLAGDQAFNFIGLTHFTGAAGQLRTYIEDGMNWAAGDVNGDGAADFIINLGNVRAQAGDFML